MPRPVIISNTKGVLEAVKKLRDRLEESANTIPASEYNPEADESLVKLQQAINALGDNPIAVSIMQTAMQQHIRSTQGVGAALAPIKEAIKNFIVATEAWLVAAETLPSRKWGSAVTAKSTKVDNTEHKERKERRHETCITCGTTAASWGWSKTDNGYRCRTCTVAIKKGTLK